jgi:hypothetical protein
VAVHLGFDARQNLFPEIHFPQQIRRRPSFAPDRRPVFMRLAREGPSKAPCGDTFEPSPQAKDR